MGRLSVCVCVKQNQKGKSMFRKKIFFLFCMILIASVFSGCAAVSRMDYDACREQVALLKKRLYEAKQEQVSDLEDFEQRLKDELAEYKGKLEKNDRGVVITFLAEVFFNSGQADLRDKAKEALAKVSAVLNKEALASMIEVEGHTDNEPIKHSGWKSNWELASARSMAVLHYFVDECGVDPSRLRSTSYGEFSPVASNETPETRQQNRRVEVVILPVKIKKVK